jgi:hypothetical protein
MTKRDQIRAFNSWLGEVATKFGFTFIVALLTLGAIQNGSAQTITVLLQWYRRLSHPALTPRSRRDAIRDRHGR